MRVGNLIWLAVLVVMLAAVVCHSEVYKQPGINGYVGADGKPARPDDPNATINPIFRGWATGVLSYQPAPEYLDPWWQDPSQALGPATADDSVVSLGDLSSDEISDGCGPGQIVLSFDETIRDANGYDFVVFENGFFYPDPPGEYGAGIGQMFAELAYVEVSSDGVNFARFPSVSLNPGPVGQFGTIETGNIYNLAGKHANNWDGLIDWIWCTGTPFDLCDVADEPNVVCGIVDINNINYVRIVDIPGSGDFYDEATRHIDPDSWNNYENNHPIYDAWLTLGSSGFDLDAIGVLKEQEYAADINLDGIVDFFDFALLAAAWQSYFGQDNWRSRCDLAEPKDLVVDVLDLAVFTDEWLKTEKWYNQ